MVCLDSWSLSPCPPVLVFATPHPGVPVPVKITTTLSLGFFLLLRIRSLRKVFSLLPCLGLSSRFLFRSLSPTVLSTSPLYRTLVSCVTRLSGPCHCPVLVETEGFPWRLVPSLFWGLLSSFIHIYIYDPPVISSGSLSTIYTWRHHQQLRLHAPRLWVYSKI